MVVGDPAAAVPAPAGGVANRHLMPVLMCTGADGGINFVHTLGAFQSGSVVGDESAPAAPRPAGSELLQLGIAGCQMQFPPSWNGS